LINHLLNTLSTYKPLMKLIKEERKKRNSSVVVSASVRLLLLLQYNLERHTKK